MRWLSVPVFLTLLASPTASAQESSYQYRFTPYEVGNMWEYQVFEHGEPLRYQVTRVERDSTLDGNIWAVISSSRENAAEPDYECIVRWSDEFDRWIFGPAGNCTSMCMIDVGPTVNPGAVSLDQVVQVGQETVHVNAVIRDSLDYWTPSRIDEYRVWYATDVGMYQCSTGRYSATLEAAIIDGRVLGSPRYISTSVAELERNFDGARSIYPNPTRGRTTVRRQVELAGVVDVTVFDVLGRQIYRSTLSHPGGELRHDVDMAHMSPGVYFIVIATRTRQESDVSRVVKL